MRKASILTLFYKSITSIKSIAMFRFLGIGKTIQYIFFLVFLSSLPGMYRTIIGEKNILTDGWAGMTLDAGTGFVIIPVLIVSGFIFSAMILFLKVSILAAAGTLFAKLLKRKLTYGQSYRITSFSITIPTVIFTCLAILNINFKADLYVDIIISLLILYSSIRQIPKPKFS